MKKFSLIIALITAPLYAADIMNIDQEQKTQSSLETKAKQYFLTKMAQTGMVRDEYGSCENPGQKVFDEMPVILQSNFKGVSFQDLFSNAPNFFEISTTFVSTSQSTGGTPTGGLFVLSNLLLSDIDGIVNLPDIQNAKGLDLTNNLLTNLSSTNLNLPKLQYLSLSGNQLDQFLSLDSYLPNLATLDLDNTNLDDRKLTLIASLLNKLSNLSNLSLKDNHLTTFPENLELPQKTRIYLKGNKINEETKTKIKNHYPHLRFFFSR